MKKAFQLSDLVFFVFSIVVSQTAFANQKMEFPFPGVIASIFNNAAPIRGVEELTFGKTLACKSYTQSWGVDGLNYGQWAIQGDESNQVKSVKILQRDGVINLVQTTLDYRVDAVPMLVKRFGSENQVVGFGGYAQYSFRKTADGNLVVEKADGVPGDLAMTFCFGGINK